VRAPARTSIFAVLVAGLGSLAVAAAAAAPPDLSVSDLFTSGGHGTKLAAGVTYQASEFPLALRVTPPDGSWAGAQWKANLFSSEEIQKRHLKCSTTPAVCRPPYYGWAALGQGGTSPRVGPRGVIIIMTGYDRTPSVAATVESLRTRGRGATYQPTAPVKLAGVSGIQFDGQLVGPSHQFIPFSPPTHKAGGFADAIEVEGAGHGFRFIVLNVRGKTVVVAIAQFSWMSADQYVAFLPKTPRILESLRFPG
jgi:hypothetical protein